MLIKKAIGIDKGSKEPNRIKVGEITKSQIEEIAKLKLKDLNARTIEAATKIIEGTAKSMGVKMV